MIPAANAGQKPRPRRSANPSGTKNGKPSGTRIRVSRARRETAGKSRCCVQAKMKARLLIRGKVSSKAPTRGNRFPTSETATMIAPEIAAFNSIHHIVLLYLLDAPDLRRAGHVDRRIEAAHKLAQSIIVRFPAPEQKPLSARVVGTHGAPVGVRPLPRASTPVINGWYFAANRIRMS